MAIEPSFCVCCDCAAWETIGEGLGECHRRSPLVMPWGELGFPQGVGDERWLRTFWPVTQEDAGCWDGLEMEPVEVEDDGEKTNEGRGQADA